METKENYSIDEVAQILGCTRQNICAKLVKLNDKKLAYKTKKGQRDIWRITQKGLESLGYNATETKSNNVAQTSSNNCSNSCTNNDEVIELYKQIIADKNEQIETIKNENKETLQKMEQRYNQLENMYQKMYALAKQILENQTPLLNGTTDNETNNSIIENTEKSEQKRKWWQFWKR